jgi:hypothetical protein
LRIGIGTTETQEGREKRENRHYFRPPKSPAKATRQTPATGAWRAEKIGAKIMATPDFTPLTNAIINGFGQMLVWLIPVLLVVGVINIFFGKLERKAKRRERVNEQLKYEEELEQERARRRNR